jgi:hypothetical protein
MGVSELVTSSARVSRHKLFIRNRRWFDEQVAHIPETWELEIAIKRVRATRSMQQNRWYWGCLVQLVSDHTGYSLEEIHDIYKAKFLPKHLALSDGNGEVVSEFVIGGSTRTLDKVQFGEYCEAIRAWAADELNVTIPDPSEAL